jgi:hypothetical protein
MRSKPFSAIAANCSLLGWPELAKVGLYWRKLIISSRLGSVGSIAWADILSDRPSEAIATEFNKNLIIHLWVFTKFRLIGLGI